MKWLYKWLGNLIWGPVEDEVKRIQDKMQRGYWRVRFGKLNAPNSKPKQAMDAKLLD